MAGGARNELLLAPLVMPPHKSIVRGPIRKQLATPRWRRSSTCRDRAEALDLVQQDGNLINMCSRQLQADVEVVAAAVSNHRGVAFRFVLPELVTAELVGVAVVAVAARGYWEDYTDLAAELEGLWQTLLSAHETWADVVAGLLRVFGGPWAGHLAAGQAWRAAEQWKIETGFGELQHLVRARQRLLLAQVLRQGQPDEAFVRLLDQWPLVRLALPAYGDEEDQYDQVVLALRYFVDRWAL
eukprot:COSAG01_NODE_723_length_14060_cov_132.571807_13_plen_241_part_00